MRGLRKAAPAVIGASVIALTLAACGGSSDSGSGGSGGSDSYVTVNSSEPQNPLIPANTNETSGGNVIDNMFTMLVRYNPENAAPENAVATSITSERPDQLGHTDPRRLDVPGRHSGDRQQFRGRVELGRLRPQRGSELLLLRAHRGLRGRAGRVRRRGQPGRQAEDQGDVGSEGGQRHRVHGETEPAELAVPGGGRLLRLRPDCRRSSSTTRRRSARTRSATARSSSRAGTRRSPSS